MLQNSVSVTTMCNMIQVSLSQQKRFRAKPPYVNKPFHECTLVQHPPYLPVLALIISLSVSIVISRLYMFNFLKLLLYCPNCHACFLLCAFFAPPQMFLSQANQFAANSGFSPNPSMFSQVPGGYPAPQPGGPPAPSPNQPYGLYPQPGGGMPQGPGMGYPSGPAPGQQMPGYPNAPGPNPSVPSYPKAPSPNPSMPAYGGGYGGGAPAVPAINVQ